MEISHNTIPQHNVNNSQHNKNKPQHNEISTTQQKQAAATEINTKQRKQVTTQWQIFSEDLVT